KVMVQGNVEFVPDEAKFMPGAEPVLEQALKFLKETPDVTLMRIEGHCNNNTYPKYAPDVAKELTDLSGKRALAVVGWLTDHGVARGRLLAGEFGGSRLVDKNVHDAVKSELNRRVEFHVAKKGGKSVAKDDADGGTVFK